MADRGDGEVAGVLNAFLQRFLEDRKAGRPTDLENYRLAFPGYEDLVESEYHSLLSSIARGDGDSAGIESSTEPELRFAASPDLPARIGPYHLLEVLGEGGMGTVVLAEQREPLHRLVALKVIKLGMDTKEILARFEAERAALALMSHPNIASVFEAGSTELGRPYFVMEYVPGSPVSVYCDEKRLGIRERLELFMQICDGVQHAHQKGVIHRDLKSSNILVSTVDDEPFPKIIDFGIAKSLSRPFTEHTLHTERGQLLGTYEFMSPEQARNDRDIDTRTDIYSLGVILYEILVGTLPLQHLREDGFDRIRQRICEEVPDRPSVRFDAVRRRPEDAARIARRRGASIPSLSRALRGDLGWIVMKALEKDRRARYAAVSELADDIRRYLADQPVLARRWTPAYQLGKFASRHRRALGVATVALLLVVGSWFLSERYGLRRRNREADELNRQAIASLETSRLLESELSDLRSEYRRARAETGTWWPVWERSGEIRLRNEVRSLESEIWAARFASIGLFRRAQEIASPESEPFRAAQQQLASLAWARDQESWPTNLTQLVDTFGVVEEEPEARIAFVLETSPGGAEVYCFRYELHEEHLLPIPFDARAGRHDPGKGLVGEPFLRVERRWDYLELEIEDPARKAELYPFHAGDRLLRVNETEVRHRGDLARALQSVLVDERVTVTLRCPESGGEKTERVWVPFPPERFGKDSKRPFQEPIRPGRVLDIRVQFAITFEGYPLDPSPGCRLETSDGSTHSVDLPAGSYLLLIRRDGHVETRLPIASGLGLTERGRLSVTLLEDAAMPPGFVHIPAGPFFAGGDREAEQTLPAQVHDLPVFLMKRFEVTFDEYTEFLNDARNGLDIYAKDESDEEGSPEEGSAEAPRSVLDAFPPRVSQQVEEMGIRFQVVPRWGGELIYTRDSGRWTQTRFRGDFPVCGVSAFAAAAYANWMSAKHPGWRFRLPTDLEWEKAARGVDRRTYVWGPEADWRACHSLFYRYPTAKWYAATVGAFPLDESPFGVRDMAGSFEEPTSDAVGSKDARFVSYRGTSCFGATDFELRCANRNGRYPEYPIKTSGIRVVAELPGGRDE